MKRNTITVIIGSLLLLIFAVLLFTFQVRQTEVAVVTTFDKPGEIIEKPGLNWKWPRPIQKVYKFDRRIHSYEGRFEQALTQDNYPLLVMVYVGWTISDPKSFFNSFPGGKASEAEPALGGLIESSKNEVVGMHPFSHFVSTDENLLQFDEIERQIMNAIRPVAASKYGIDVKFVGIKKLGLPQDVTEKVFARMQAERDREVQRIRGEGEAVAMRIRSNADRERDKILAEATSKAIQIRGEADAQSAESFKVFEQNADLAMFLLNVKTLEETLKEKSTLILDERTPPYDLLIGTPKPASKSSSVPTLRPANP
ncbi:MAG: protease modulator HflC [Verrucomicrobia bacterium]|nr:protease modulator HflC [Verrucomicrobiota bacterium]